MSGSCRARDAGPAVILAVACPAPTGCLPSLLAACATKYPLRCLRHSRICGRNPCVTYVTLKVGHIVASPRLAVDLCPWQGSACRDRDRNDWFMASGVAGEIFAARADRIWFTKHSIPRWRPHLCVGRTLCLPHQRIACTDIELAASIAMQQSST